MNAEFLKRFAKATIKPNRTNREGLRRRNRGDISLVHLLSQATALLGLAAGSYLFVSHFVVQAVHVSGTSMMPTLHDADCYFLNRLGALFRSPQRGDIVVLRDPTDQSYAVKRIIGVAGDTVELRAGLVYINGKQLKESYLLPGTETFPFNEHQQTVHCDPDHFFVLGDNRFHSSDSRCYGPVARHAILGVVMR